MKRGLTVAIRWRKKEYTGGIISGCNQLRHNVIIYLPKVILFDQQI
jgi:hypothetical protein